MYHAWTRMAFCLYTANKGPTHKFKVQEQFARERKFTGKTHALPALSLWITPGALYKAYQQNHNIYIKHSIFLDSISNECFRRIESRYKPEKRYVHINAQIFYDFEKERILNKKLNTWWFEYQSLWLTIIFFLPLNHWKTEDHPKYKTFYFYWRILHFF